MDPNNRRHFIRLVYSAPVGGNEVNAAEPQETEKVWGQLELFTTEKPDAMIFAQPDRLGFEGIVQIVAMGHARRIFDLREMPFISFGNETRESFLRVLMRNHVEYFNVFRLRGQLGVNEDMYDDVEKSLSFEENKVLSFLKPMIERGPTVVFSDCDPSKDNAVKKLLTMLSKAKISFSPVYANNE